MSRFSLSGYAFALAALLGAMGCSSNDTTPGTGSGGQGSGGAKSGGAGGTGGSSQAGGSGGTVGSGGSSTVGSGGASTGGTTGKGGTTSASGGTTGGSTGPRDASAGSGGSTSALDGGPGSGGATSPRDGGAGFDGRTAEDGKTGSGGLGGGTGGTATGGTSGNNPCKASPCVILPLGDSITHGFNSSDDAGYRSGLFKLAVAASQNITFIGSQTNPKSPLSVSGKDLPRNHEGHDGYTVSQIAGLVSPKPAFSGTPHIVLLHAGTNDMTSNADPTKTADQLDTLIGDIVAAAPDALVVVAKIVPLGYSNSNYTSYIAKIPDLVKARAAKNQNVVMVDMSALPSSDIRGNGNVHPTDKGYSDMADLWYGVIKGYLPK